MDRARTRRHARCYGHLAMNLCRFFRIALAVLPLSCGWLAAACSSSTGSSGGDGNASSDDASARAPKVTIISPKPNQQFSTTDKIPLEGTGIDPVDGDIGKAADAPQRMIWGFVETHGVNPAGEGPSDAVGAGTDHPVDAGTYQIRFSVTNTSGVTGTADVTIVVR